MADKSKEALANNCPNCGGPLRYDPTIEKLKCDFCDSEFTVEEVEKFYESHKSEAQAEYAKDEVVSYGCSSCGAELIADANTAVIRCPYCGNNTIATAQFAAGIKPDYVVPFKFTKQQAEAKYADYYKGRFLLPKAFLTDSNVEEIQGVYVPFWLFNGSSFVRGTYNTHDEHEDNNFKYLEHYEEERKGTMRFENVPADASKRMADDLMDTIEPYDFKQMKPFAMSYLPGFLAERFDVDEKDDKNRATGRIEQTTKDEVRKTLKHNNLDRSDEDVTVQFTKTNYALLPVWLLTTRYNNAEWTFAMNGQTGEFTGNLPINGAKFGGVLTILFAAIVLIAHFLFDSMGVGFVVAAIVTAITGFVMWSGMKPVSHATTAGEYISMPLKLSYERESFIRTEKIRKEKKEGD